MATTLQKRIEEFSVKYFNDSLEEAKEYASQAVLNPYINISADLRFLTRKMSLYEIEPFINEVKNFFKGYIIFPDNLTNQLKQYHYIVNNWKEVLTDESTFKLENISSAINFSLSLDDLAELALLHKTEENLREKIEDILTDCNFHSEYSDFSSGLYKVYLK
jgi:hypothetical protein